MQPNESRIVRLRLRAAGGDGNRGGSDPFSDFDVTFTRRKSEADEFYGAIIPDDLDAESRNVARQGYAGLLWSKQFYNYVIREWLNGDPGQPKPPAERLRGRNSEWKHLFNRDIISMPDKWEYPWFAAWDLALHMVPFSKSPSQRLILILPRNS
jgi:hypothetical protein